MGGYGKEALPAMQKRMVDRVAAIPGVTAAGLVDNPPIGSGANTTTVFSDSTTDLRPSNAAAQVVLIKTSPDYFRVAETSLLSGRGFTSHDDRNDPLVAVVNQEFARKIFGSAANALGHYFKKNDGTRIQIVGIVQDGKYNSLTEDPQPAMFLPLLQSPASLTYLVLRSERDPQELAAVVRSKLRELDPGLPFNIQTWTQSMSPNRFGARMAAMSLGVLGVMAAMLAIIGVFGTAAYSISKRMKELGIRIALGAHRKEVLEAALGRAIKLLALGSVAGLLLGILSSRVLAYVVYQASPRDPLVLTGGVVAMALLGLLATWIPAQRALSVNPLILLREE
jgi:predicted permease